MSSEEWYTVVFDIPAPLAKTILELMTGQCRHFRFYPAKDQGQPMVIENKPEPAPTEPWRDERGHLRRPFKRTAGTGQWSEKFWPKLEPIFANGPVRFDDQRLRDVLTGSGHSPKSVSAVLSELCRRGFLEHGEHRGWWQRPKKPA